MKNNEALQTELSRAGLLDLLANACGSGTIWLKVKCERVPREMGDQLWSKVEISALLQAYNVCYTSIDKGNFHPSDWQLVVDEVN